MGKCCIHCSLFTAQNTINFVNIDAIVTVSPNNSLHPHPQVPGYLLGEKLDWGDRLQTFRAVETATQRVVIVELLASQHLNGEELVRFRHRYAIAKQLDIPGILRPERLLTWDNNYAIVSPDWPGISLARDRHQRVLSIDTILAIALQLAEILHALQQVGAIHKQIDPTNILIDPSCDRVLVRNFGIAELFPREAPKLEHPHRIEGNLAYISPEQTGRMNRGIDYRTDFYSLGVTLYELLANELPFQPYQGETANRRTADLLELVHCHIAQTPIPVCDRQPQIPAMVSQIVAKLMAKNVEDRYQSALGLQYDLRVCAEQWQASGSIDRFALGARDLSDRFIIPERLYGRERATATLLAAFDRVSDGATELFLVAGSSGTGKTSVVNEIYQPITRQHGYFIQGKFGKFDRSLPLSAFVQALRDLVGQLLGESDAELASWKAAILQALGEQAGIIVDALPELAQIIGSQPPAPELSGTAAHHRFNLLFHNLIRVFATVEHPLVIFLDDLQWADPTSLGLVELLMTEAPTPHLLIIGAYRDNEVSPADPLLLTVAQIAKSSSLVTSITLAPLAIADVERLVADTLNCSVLAARPLAELIERTTHGNPFFVGQLLVALHRDGKITFASGACDLTDRQTGYWQCDLTQIQTATLTDDVVEFVAGRLGQLPPATQEILKLAACIGDRFDLETLAIVAQQSLAAVAAALREALQIGQIVPLTRVYEFWDDERAADEIGLDRYAVRSDLAVLASSDTTYRFLHDRVRQAAYSLIPAECKQIEHLQIGRLLLAQISDDACITKLFELVNHLNVGRAFVECREGIAIARLNLTAAQKARAATAYRAALDYATIGIELLATIGWDREYGLCLSLHQIAAETAFLAGEFDRATELVEIVKRQARTILDRIPAYETQIQLFSVQKNYRQAIEWGLEILAELGVRIPIDPSKFRLLQAALATKLQLRGRSIETLEELPLMTDPRPIAITRILDLLSYPAYDYSKSLLGLMAFVGVQTSLKYGNSIWSARLYSLYCVVLADVRDFAASYQMGQLALRLADRLPNLAIDAKVKFDVAFFGLPCQQPLRNSLPLHRSAMQSAVANGDRLYTGIGYYGDCVVRLNLSEPLDELLALAAGYRQAMVATTDRTSQFLMDILYHLLLKLQRPDLDPTHLLDDATADLQASERAIAERGTLCLSVFYAYKQFLGYLFEDIPTALKYADLGEPLAAENAAPFSSAQLETIEALIRLAAYPHSSPSQQYQLLDRVTHIQQQLAQRAKFAPCNLQVKTDTIAAERCRVLGDRIGAIELYDRAIAGATAERDLQYVALANELAAKFYLEWGKEKIATVYLQAAYANYALWGAAAKTADLARRYPQLLAPLLHQRNEHSSLAAVSTAAVAIESASGDLTGKARDGDLAAILQSIRILSSTNDLADLLHKLTEIALTTSGAQTCMLALPDSTGEWQLGSLVTVNPDRLPLPQLPQLLADTGQYPASTIYWVKNTRQQLACDASKPLEIPDRYLLTYQPRSVFCVPIVRQERILGVLYLEHRQAPNLFDRDKQIVISFLCAQAAIAVENTWLDRAAQASTANVQSQQAYLATLLDNIPHMAWLKDEQRRYIAANRQLAEVAGAKDSSELVGKNDFDFWPSDLAQAFQDDDLRVMASGCQTIVEEQITQPNGEYRWLETIKTPIRNSDGQITGTVGIALDITDRRQIEADLRQSQQQYQRLSDNIPGAIYQFRLAPDGQISYPYISSGCQELFQVSPAAVMADANCLINLFHPDDLVELKHLVSESASSMEFKLWEGRGILPSGETIWVKSASRPTLQADGAIVWDGIMLDVTDRKVVEQALLASQRQYQRLADNIPGVIYQFRLTPDGQVSVPYISSGCQDLFGLAPATIVADLNSLIELTHPDDLCVFQVCVAASARDLSFFAWEGRVVLADRTAKWVELASRPELQPDGAIVWDGVMLDITKRKQAELDLATSQQKYYNLIQSIPGVVWEYDFTQNKFKFVNDRAEVLLGYPIQDWIDRPDFWSEHLHPDDRDATIQLYSDAIDDRQGCEAEYRMLAADGRIVWIYDISAPVLDLNGKLIATNGLMIDITDRQLAIHELQQAEIALRETNDRLAATNQELLRATKLKDEFLATMSHELRTPLNAILGMSECLTEGIFGEVNERQTKSIDTIHRSGQHLLALINDILDVSKIAAGKLELELTSVPLQRLCDASLALVRAQADRKQIAIDTYIPPQIGTLWIDERRMRQVALNLLSNAVKFTPKGGRITLAAEIIEGRMPQIAIDLLPNAVKFTPKGGHITLATETIATTDRVDSDSQDDGAEGRDWVRISVTDTGIGISPTDRDRLFQPFVQIDSSLNRQYEGSGLGLALVKQMVELHGGYVTLESQLGRGSCFSVYLPYSAGDRRYFNPSDPLDSCASSSDPEVTASPDRVTILLAEDNPTNLITFVSYLNVKGYRTIAAKDGAEAIDLAIAHRPDLILMDIQMPGIDGITAILKIRQDPLLRRIPIVALTALATPTDRQKCLNAGANEFLVKPVKLKELDRTIQNCLNLN
jgi:PAS domain S-box-containing protein